MTMASSILNWVYLLTILLSNYGVLSRDIRSCDEVKPGCTEGYIKIYVNECDGDIFYCVKPSDVAGTWEEMQEYCKKEGGQLLDVPSLHAFRNLIYSINNDFATEERLDGFWIGGSDMDYEGEFVWPDQKLVQMGTPFWGDDNDDVQDPDGGDDENCMFLPAADHFFFTDRSCLQSHRALCRAKPHPYVKIRSKVCLQFDTIFKGTWFEAERHCKNTRGSKMVDMGNLDLMHDTVNYIQNEGLDPQGDGFWVGGRQAYSKKFQWSGSSKNVAMGTPYWGRDIDDVQDPDEDGEDNCILMSKNDFYFFADRKCTNNQTETHSVICYHIGPW